MGLQPSAVVNNANGRLLVIARIVDDVHLPTPERMRLIAIEVDGFRSAVAGSTTDPFRV